MAKVPWSPRIFKEFAAAASYGNASRSMQNKNYDAAFKEVLPVVDFDLPIKDPYLSSSRYIISYLYHHGYGTIKDHNLSHKYLKLAAEGGDENAINVLAIQNQEPSNDE